ncbi:YDG domain-containing protein, partial [Rubrivivax gelatinosus]|uniref:YDG domain-containing protein n=1 Tax=Rubrivivax gelatinosus TaxID=28068 RepID=UPI00104FC105
MNHGPGALNRIYRLVWNDSTGACVAVAEGTRARGKRSSGVAGVVLGAGLVLGSTAAWAGPPAANALPQGGQLVSGQATAQRQGARLDISQTSQRAAINWTNFDIGSQARVQIQQPNARSVLLNRVTGADPSAIHGRLDANGQVLLVNPNGIVFGRGSRVDVGGLVASTLDIADADFAAGRLKFTRGTATGSVVNQGTINAAAGGYVALLAPEVINEGLVSARLGTVALAAGDAVTLDVAGSELLGVRVDPATVAALVENRQIVQAEDGRVILSAGAAQRLREQAVAGSAGADALVDDGGTLRLVSAGGRVEAGSGRVQIEGSTVEVDGRVAAAGGRIDVQADYLGQGGVLDTSVASGRGGRITVDAGSVVQTASAALKADGSRGGEVRLTADERVYSSATFSAQGRAGRGGDVALTADSVQLRAATLDASGRDGGGRVRVGGGFQGGDADLANARELGVNGTTVLRADATRRGDGGEVVLWSDERTTFGGRVSARGGARGGNGGSAEVSGKQDLVFGGTADLAAPKGRAGRLLLDPRNIIIDNAGNSIASLSLDDPTAAADNGFGTFTKVLSNGNVIISAPQADTGATSDTGAVYLFNASTGALLSNLRGAAAGDRAGSGGVQVLSSENYLVLSPRYGTVSSVNTFSSSTADPNTVPGASAYAIQQSTTASAGAVTWQSKAGSGSTTIGSGNSLVGSTTNTDSVTRYSYTGNTINNLGAITITADDRLGNITTYDVYGSVATAGTTTITELANGNVVVAAPNWYNGRGAAAWINGSTGVLANGAAGGAVSSSTAFVGSTGIRSQALVDTDSSSKKVYVIGVDQSLPYTYTQGATNRRTAPPGGAGDAVGQSITALSDGSFVVSSPAWTNGASAYAGAVTYGPAGGGAGTVGAGNSLVGSHAYDFVGSGGIFAVGSGDYVVASPYWSDSGNGAVGRYLENAPNGAVTWVAGGTGHVYGGSSTGATVGSGNSLTGSAGSALGALDSSASAPYTTYDYSATYVLTTTQSTRTQASGIGVTVLDNGNYLAVNRAWNGGYGSVSFGQGTSGLAGAVSSANSLVGSNVGDSAYNSIVLLSDSHYLVVSPYSDVGASDGGAVTWGSGSSGVSGTVSTANSLYGSHVGDRVGLGGALPVGTLDADGRRPNAIVLSPHWGNRSAATSTVAYGAVTWIDGSDGQARGEAGTGAAVAAANSLVGSHDGDYVGSIHLTDARSTTSVGNGSNLQQVQGAWDAQLSASVDLLANGDYIVRSPGWDSGKGAVSWGAGASGTAGAVSASNSLVGSISDVVSTSTATQTRAGMSFTDTTYRLTTTGDHVGLLGFTLANGNYLAISPLWNGGRGAVTWVGSGQRTGTVSSSNSLVGSTPDTYADVNQSSITAVGDRLGTMPNASWVVPVVSETTSGGNTYTTTSQRLVGPYNFGVASTVATESWYSGGGSVTLGRNYYVNYGPQNLSLVSEWDYLTTNFRYNGVPIVKELANGNVLVASPGWNNTGAAQAGAVSWINGSTGALAGGGSGGTLSASNSLVGSHAGDVLGYRLPVDGVAELSNGNFILLNPQWYAERGAATWGSGTAGVTGTVSASNSLVGSTGSGSLGFTTTNSAYRLLPNGDLNGDWVDRTSDLAGDRVGDGGVTVLADGNAVIGSPLWSQSSAWTQVDRPESLGAATWINGSNGQLKTGAAGGTISATNSLVGGQHGDAVGYNAWVDPYSGLHYVTSGVTALDGGAYVVASPWWSNGSTTGVGAVTHVAAGGRVGTVGTSNSLVGGSAGDHIGRTLSGYDAYTFGAQIDRGIVVVESGGQKNYLVRSTDWTNTFSGGAAAGAVTWVDGSTGRAYGESGKAATVSERNSLVGNSAADGVGTQFIVLTREVSGVQVATGDVLALSNLTDCGEAGAGAITLISGAHGASGPVSWRNSVIGLAAASDNLSTSGFDGSSYTSDLRATLLPSLVTSAEQVAWRPLVWVNPNATTGANASQALALTLLADNNSAPVSSDQINGVGGNANWDGSLYAGNGSGFTGIGGSSGLLAFNTHTGQDAVITPQAITAMLNAGTAVTLQASNDITVLRDIVVSAGGHGGDLTLEAGRSVYLRAVILTDNGDFNVIANQSLANGVVDADCSACTAQIIQATGSLIDAGSGNVSMRLLDGSDKTYGDAGNLLLASIDGAQVLLSNAGVDASSRGMGLRFQDAATIGSADTDSVSLFARGNSAASGGVVLAWDTQFSGWGSFTIASADDSGGMRLGASSGGGFALTAAEIGALIQHSDSFGNLQFGSGDQSGSTIVSSLDFSQASMLRGGATLDTSVGIVGGSGGVSVTGTLTTAVSTDWNFELSATDGTLSLAASSHVNAATGTLVLTTHGGSITQGADATVDATRLHLQGDGTVTMTAGSNTLGTLTGHAGGLNLRTVAAVTVGNQGLSTDSGLTLHASGASSDITLAGTVSNGSGNLVLAAGRHFVNSTTVDTGIDAGSGRYLVYSTSPSGTTEGMTGYDKHYAQSYSAGSTPAYAASGDWFLYSVAPTLTVTAGSGSSVVYGSGASTPTVSITGFIDGDTVASATTGALDTSLSSYTASGAGYIPVGSYTLALDGQGSFASDLGYTINVTTGSSTLTVTPKAINVSGLSANGKVYDGTTSTTVSGTAAIIGGGSASGDGKYLSADVVSVSGTATGAFADRHAGTGKSVTLSGLTLSGADAANYTISTDSVTADITRKTLTVSGLSVASSKVYDGSLSATVSGSGSLLSSQAAGSGSSGDGRAYSGDTIALSGTATGSYNAASVASANTVSFGGLTLSGAEAGNYVLDLGSQAATITPKALTITGLTAQNKVYDATTAASFSGSAALSGVVGSDVVALTGTLAAAFANADAGTNKGITTSGLTLTGAAAGNYSLTALTAQADITARTLDVNALDRSKTYGGADPTLSFSVGGLGLVGGDSAADVFAGLLSTVTGASATAGTHAITQGTLAVADGNYQLGTFTAGTLTVAKAQLDVTAADRSKVYGAADPTLGYVVDASDLKYADTAAVVSGVSLATATGAAATAGTHAITASGGAASNYELVLHEGTLTVAKAQLTVSANGASKVYGAADPTLGYT